MMFFVLQNKGSAVDESGTFLLDDVSGMEKGQIWPADEPFFARHLKVLQQASGENDNESVEGNGRTMDKRSYPYGGKITGEWA